MMRDPALVENVAEYCAPPAPLPGDDLDAVSCSAGHSSCYISPCGDVYSCVQLPLPSGKQYRLTELKRWAGRRYQFKSTSPNQANQPESAICVPA